MTHPKDPTAQRMETQCWICPVCHDDHPESAHCTPPDTKPFMPSPDDHSYIAEQYRALVAQLSQLQDELQTLKNPSDRRCMEIVALREHVKQFRAENETLKLHVTTSRIAAAAHLDASCATADQLARERDRANRYAEALKYIAGGCLVPPDGGSPNLDDAVDAARAALAEQDQEKGEGK